MTPILMGSWAAAGAGAPPRTVATISMKPTRTMSRFIAPPSALSPHGPDHASHVRRTRELNHRGEGTVNEGRHWGNLLRHTSLRAGRQALNVHPRTPRAAGPLAPRLARTLPQCQTHYAAWEPPR